MTKLEELYAVYCDLDRQAQTVVKEEIRLLSTPEMQLVMAIKELNRHTQQTVRDLQSLRKGA